MATTDAPTAYIKRIERRDKIISLVTRSLTPLRYGSVTEHSRQLTRLIHGWRRRIFMFAIGYLWLLGLPTGLLGRGTYIDENALGPAQVGDSDHYRKAGGLTLYHTGQD